MSVCMLFHILWQMQLQMQLFLLKNINYALVSPFVIS